MSSQIVTAIDTAIVVPRGGVAQGVHHAGARGTGEEQTDETTDVIEKTTEENEIGGMTGETTDEEMAVRRGTTRGRAGGNLLHGEMVSGSGSETGPWNGDKDSGVKPTERPYERDGKPAEQRAAGEPERTQSESVPPPAEQPVQRGASEVPPDGYEEGEEMDITNDGDADMMAMMGMSGFGSTKGRHVEGNQEGSVDVKKIRTWRQYMNRRGGFNRPLDKIK
ncbi:U4/U6.U5 small nuclear ribonucleoprotein [Grifola frondosa]|uniref:U4/U6.U5 small nuclear ribonucleoprotein n=1 Tax=Grifola frondosa TaxID=5627 RepID=A0A1C7MF86_GRIFR|nr:U4/U6.U5 small nuclear ribonucleoprotein [Grifola frondosa]